MHKRDVSGKTPSRPTDRTTLRGRLTCLQNKQRSTQQWDRHLRFRRYIDLSSPCFFTTILSPNQMLKQILVIFLLITAIVAERAYFAATTDDVRDGEFILELTDSRLIKHARKLVNGETSNSPHISGRIVKIPRSYNPLYSYYIEPRSIKFFHYAMESCDSTFSYAERNLDDVGGDFLPDNLICPSTSQLLREVDSSFMYNFQANFRAEEEYLC